MSSQVTSICQSINFCLRNLSKIRCFLYQECCTHAMRDLSLPRLDNANSLLVGFSSSDILKIAASTESGCWYHFPSSTPTSPYTTCVITSLSSYSDSHDLPSPPVFVQISQLSHSCMLLRRYFSSQSTTAGSTRSHRYRTDSGAHDSKDGFREVVVYLYPLNCGTTCL